MIMQKTPRWANYTEIINSVFWVVWGAWIANPYLTTFAGPNYRAMFTRDEPLIGIALLLFGSAQFVAAKYLDRRIRAGSLYLDFVLWVFWTSQFLESNRASVLGPSCFIMGVSTFVALAFLMGWRNGSETALDYPPDNYSGQRNPLPYHTIMALEERAAEGIEEGREDSRRDDSLSVDSKSAKPSQFAPDRAGADCGHARRASDKIRGSGGFRTKSAQGGFGSD